MKNKIKSFSFYIIVSLAFLFVLPPISQAQDYTISLNILNKVGPSGAISVVAGTGVQVEFSIIDPNKELSTDDQIRLVKVYSGEEIHIKKRGNNLNGSIVLETDSEAHAGCEAVVEYIHNDKIIATAPAYARLFIKAEISKTELLNRLIAIETLCTSSGSQGQVSLITAKGDRSLQDTTDFYTRDEIKTLFADLQAQIDALQIKILSHTTDSVDFRTISIPINNIVNFDEIDNYGQPLPQFELQQWER